MMLKQEVVNALKTDSELQEKLAKYYDVKPLTVWHMAHRNSSHKLHSIGALEIMSKHLGLPINDMIAVKEVADGVV